MSSRPGRPRSRLSSSVRGASGLSRLLLALLNETQNIILQIRMKDAPEMTNKNGSFRPSTMKAGSHFVFVSSFKECIIGDPRDGLWTLIGRFALLRPGGCWEAGPGTWPVGHPVGIPRQSKSPSASPPTGLLSLNVGLPCGHGRGAVCRKPFGPTQGRF